MGLADRFKEKLEKRDIFKQTEAEKTINNSNIMFISKPIAEKEDLKSSNIVPAKIEIKNRVSNFEDLETDIIAKIRKTPYWDEYSPARQKNMISKYFDAKTKHTDTTITNSEKQEFVNNILALSNNR